LKCCDSRSRFIDQGLNHYRCHAQAFHVERVGCTRREIEDASASVWTPVVDFDDDGLAVAEVRHLCRLSWQQQFVQQFEEVQEAEVHETDRLRYKRIIASCQNQMLVVGGYDDQWYISRSHLSLQYPSQFEFLRPHNVHNDQIWVIFNRRL